MPAAMILIIIALTGGGCSPHARGDATLEAATIYLKTTSR